jgi:hypothetical protein
MRWCRVLVAGGLAAVLLVPGAAVAEEEHHIGLHDMACNSITAMGKGMPKDATLRLTLVDQGKGTTLAQRTVRTSATGDFMTRLQARLNQVLDLRLFVSRTDGTRVGFADHVMAKGEAMCSLPFTGPGRASLLGFGVGSLAIGLALLLAAGVSRGRWGRGRWGDAHG